MPDSGDGQPQLDPLCELFREGDPDGRTMSAMNRWMMPFGGVLMGAGAIVLQNYLAKRPVFTTIHRHFVSGAIGGALGEWAHIYRLRLTAERDLQYYHYMTLHPEDFQAPKKILFRDYLEPWMPVR